MKKWREVEEAELMSGRMRRPEKTEEK